MYIEDEKHPFTNPFTRFEEHRFMRLGEPTCAPKRVEKDALMNTFTRLGELLRASRRTNQPVKTNRKLVKTILKTS